MDVTRITTDNAEFFEDLVPEGSFGDEGLLWLGAVAEDGSACAVLGGGVHEEMGFIDWIYTAPDYREKSAADSLLKTFSTLLNRIDAEAIEIGFSDTDDGLSEFLEEEQFLISEEGDFFSVPLEDLIYSEVIEGLEEGRDPSAQIVSANELVDPRPFFGYLSDRNIPCSVYMDELRENSLILLDDNGDISGCMLIVKEPGGDVLIPYLINEGPMECITDLFLALKNLVIEKGWEEESIVFSDRSGQMIGFVEQVTDEERDHYLIRGLKSGVKLI